MAVTGLIPDLTTFAACLPPPLSHFPVFLLSKIEWLYCLKNSSPKKYLLLILKHNLWWRLKFIHVVWVLLEVTQGRPFCGSSLFRSTNFIHSEKNKRYFNTYRVKYNCFQITFGPTPNECQLFSVNIILISKSRSSLRDWRLIDTIQSKSYTTWLSFFLFIINSNRYSLSLGVNTQKSKTGSKFLTPIFVTERSIKQELFFFLV